ncbi:MAG: toxin-activating lysine-acyltransferase [Rhodoferax sp.]|uniref:toxin-activating lysine-acyltransferase n=1 Tax=Rhodoferax sp. TaxID=50421 RepID=UPI002614BEC9|nr:toxin-activating lysine-acyltransferase [Rhodoferax sp.]MDD5333745.1 toxin-activating lysine-acyltransferase [Rhodoferax sp.]
MRYSVSTVTGKAENADTHRAALVGFVCQLGAQSPVHANLPLGRTLSQLVSPVEVEQYKLYFNDFGQCVGFVTWAMLAPDVEKRLLLGEDYDLRTCEWNEGASLWIMDMVVPHGSIKHVLEDMRDKLFKDFDTLTYFRIKNRKRIFKRVSRADGGYFFRDAPSQATARALAPVQPASA